MPLVSATVTLAMCSVNVSWEAKHSGLHVRLMLIFTLFLLLERSRVEHVIRLLGCRLLGKVFALYALHTFSSRFRSVVWTWSYVTITLGFSCQDGDQNRILTAVPDLSAGHATSISSALC
jgi:predicted PurR-regulated permease PerM